MDRFTSLFNNQGIIGLISNILAVWILLAISIFVLTKIGSSFGANTSNPRGAPWTPSGALIGGVWTLLYTLMAIAMWSLNRLDLSPEIKLKWLVIGLIGFCLIWPFYAFGTTNRWPGLLGNIGIFVLSIYAVLKILPFSKITAFMILPVTIWIFIATLSILDGARRYGW